MWYLLYNITLTIGFLAVLPFVPLIYLLGPRYRDGLGQRFGIYPPTVDAVLRAARPVWIHAASVGEVRAAAPLVRALKTSVPARKVLLSTFTATGHRIAAQTAGVDAAIFLPLDFSWTVRRALTDSSGAAGVHRNRDLAQSLARIVSPRYSDAALERAAVGQGICAICALASLFPPGSWMFHIFWHAVDRGRGAAPRAWRG